MVLLSLPLLLPLAGWPLAWVEPVRASWPRPPNKPAGRQSHAMRTAAAAAAAAMGTAAGGTCWVRAPVSSQTGLAAARWQTESERLRRTCLSHMASHRATSTSAHGAHRAAGRC